MGMFMPSETVTSSPSGQEDSTLPEPLGNRLARWASNLLVSGVILIVGLVFGREVIHWWRSDSDSGTAAPSASQQRQAGGGLGSLSGSEQLLAFGDFPHTLRRSELAGDLPSVLHHLRRTCREVLAGTNAMSGQPGPAELRMLQGTDELTPIDSLPGAWSMYELRAPLPMVVGIREAAAEVVAEVATAQRRVVSWGMAFPSVEEAADSPTSWTLFTYAMGSAEAQQHDEFSLPAPGFGQKTLSLRTDASGSIRGFRGQGSASDWMAFYDKWFESNAWQAAVAWQSDGVATWRRRFAHPTLGTVDFVLSVGDSGSIQAVAVHTPRATQETR